MRLLLLILVVGCASTEQPSFEEPTIEVFQGDNFETTVTSRGTPTVPGYSMHFRGGVDAIHMPDSFRIGGTEMLIENPTCNQESEIGIAVFPAATAAAMFSGGDPTDNDDSATTNFVSIDVGGPHLARIVVGYSLDYDCAGAQKLTGESTFLFYPTGRIVRADRKITPSTNDLTSTTGCGCTGGTPATNFAFTSYWAFNEGVVNVDRAGDEIPPGGSADGACTVYTNGAIGVQFSETTTRIGVNNRASHVFDFFNRIPSTADPLLSRPEQIFSAIQIVDGATVNTDRTRCGEVLERLADPPIRIGDSQLPSSNEDGIYNDDQGIRKQPFRIRPAAGGSLPPGFTVSFELENGAARITRNPPPTVQPIAYTQRGFQGDRRFFMVFNEGLEGDEAFILVEPQ